MLSSIFSLLYFCLFPHKTGNIVLVVDKMLNPLAENAHKQSERNKALSRWLSVIHKATERDIQPGPRIGKRGKKLTWRE